VRNKANFRDFDWDRGWNVRNKAKLGRSRVSGGRRTGTASHAKRTQFPRRRPGDKAAGAWDSGQMRQTNAILAPGRCRARTPNPRRARASRAKRTQFGPAPSCDRMQERQTNPIQPGRQAGRVAGGDYAKRTQFPPGRRSDGVGTGHRPCSATRPRLCTGAAGIGWRWRRSAPRKPPGPPPAVAFWGQKFRPPTIRPPTGLWGAFGGLMIRTGAYENGVFGAGQAGMTLSGRHTHTIWRSEPAPLKMRFLAVGLLASWRSEVTLAKTRLGRRPAPQRGQAVGPCCGGSSRLALWGGAETAPIFRPHPYAPTRPLWVGGNGTTW
jgi:hypothetical protein